MPFYTIEKMQNEVDYIVTDYDQIGQAEINFIETEDKSHALEIFEILKTKRFKDLILPLADYFPKTFQYLNQFNIEYQIFFQRLQMDGQKNELIYQPFFSLNERIYYLSFFKSRINGLPDYLLCGWSKSLGGVTCSDHLTAMWGRTLIDHPFAWLSFEEYLPHKGKKALIQSLIERIDYVFVDSLEDDIYKQDKQRKNGFPNLRCMLDAREPGTRPKEYDLLLMCYDFNQTVYWVKDGDFENGLYVISQPQQMLDQYFVHVFSQHDQEFSRFDFSSWAQPLGVDVAITAEQMNEIEDDEEDESPSFRLDDPELAGKMGHVPAQLRLGMSYSLGINDFEQNLKRGNEWFWEATKSGDLVAQYNWACYWSKHPDFIDTSFLSLQDLEQMHDKGNLAATYMLGVYYEQGIDMHMSNPELAVHYYQYAARQDFAPAINNLADKYEKGLGVAQDLSQAYRLYKRAAAENIAAAQWSLALMYLNGEQVEKDQVQAKYYLELALENGWDNAATILESLEI